MGSAGGIGADDQHYLCRRRAFVVCNDLIDIFAVEKRIAVDIKDVLYRRVFFQILRNRFPRAGIGVVVSVYRVVHHLAVDRRNAAFYKGVGKHRADGDDVFRDVPGAGKGV